VSAKRLLYFTSTEVTAFEWVGGNLDQRGTFPNSDEGLPAFNQFVSTAPRALYLLLVDIVEEDFHQETIPYVRGGDRRALLGRKLAQRYRDTSLALTLSLGYESGPRKEENILFASFTNTQQFQPWLAALVSQESRVVGVFSIPLLAPLLGQRLGLHQKRFLLITRQPSGIRQSFVDNGQIRFSRLGKIDGTYMENRAKALAADTSRLHQYLTNMRMLPRDAGPLDVVVIAPDAALEDFQRACTNNAQLSYNIMGLRAACDKVGLKSAPEGLNAERLFLHVLAKSPPSRQFAMDEHRRFFNIWRAKIGTYAAGAAICALCLLVAGVRLFDFYGVQSALQEDQNQEKRFNQQYASLQARFQKTPTNTENLKGLVRNYIALSNQSVRIDPMLAGLSRVLAAVPQVELDHIDWQISGSPRRGQGATATNTSSAAAPANAPSTNDTVPVYELVEVVGRVNSTQARDYRAITRVVEQFSEALRSIPGVEIVSTELPFDLNAEKGLSGDIGAAREMEIPRFTIVYNRRVGAS
jgi:hypothetical protein